MRLVEPIGGGAEGFAFVIQNQSPTALGQAAGLGYAGISNSLAVELDSRRNVDETFAPHVSVQSLGTAANSALESASLKWFDDVPNWRDGAVHTFTVTYACGVLSVEIDAFPALSLQVDLAALLDLDAGQAWIGLTGGTGAGAWEEYRLTAWSHRNRPVGFIVPQVPKSRARTSEPPRWRWPTTAGRSSATPRGRWVGKRRCAGSSSSATGSSPVPPW
jgi:hypothetical protein